MENGLHVSHLDLPGLIGREWLATNGVGGYASSTIPCLNTRKYHGLLVAAMAPPVRRMVLLSRVEETLAANGKRFSLSASEYPGAIYPQGYQFLRAFNPSPFPRWAYQTNGGTIEKSLRLLRGENTAVISYTLLGGGGKPLALELRPLLALRPIHELMQQWNGRLTTDPPARQTFRVPATVRTPEVFFAHTGTFDIAADWYLNHVYRREFERGYVGMEDLWSPGIVKLTLAPGQPVHLICSSDPIDLDHTLERADWQCSSREYVIVPSQLGTVSPIAPPSPDPAFDTLLSAAGQFILAAPPDGTSDKPGDKSVTCIGNYPWGPPSARSALIGFTGLFLVPGRFGDARSLLLSLAAREEHGLIPTTFPEDGSAPLYDGADVSLWFIHAIWNYFRYTSDVATLRRKLLDVALRIIERYRRGTDLGIAVDSEGLLLTRAPGCATTWMDARVNDWIITPRQGRAVELNALWYNALCITAELSDRYGSHDKAAELASFACGVKDAFNRRFWNEPAGCCFDVVEDHGADASLRPNQLLAISLAFPALSLERHARLLNKVRDHLLISRGIRTLAPGSPAYIGRYEGNVVSRDRALHNGSAHPWLLGPYVTALLRVKGRGNGARDEARAALHSCLDFLTGDGSGYLCELFDGDLPHRPGGAIASASSIGEVLRAYTEEVLDLGPSMPFPVSITLTDAAVLSSSVPPVNNPA